MVRDMPFPVLCLLNRQLGGQARAVPRRRFQDQSATQQVDALLHAREPTGAGIGMEELNLKTGALILDLYAKYIRAEPNAKCGRGNARMPGHVRESLLHDAVGSGFDFLAKTPLQAAVFEVDANACLRSLAIDQP